MKSLTEYTKEEFLSMENRSPEEPFTEIIIVPTDKIHDSGYLCMKFVLCNNGRIVGVVSGWSDVVHVNGIGGYGRDYEYSLRTGMTKRVAWTIDCLTGSGCIRLLSNCECEVRDFIGSDFCFYVK